jgi:hypothetical protein
MTIAASIAENPQQKLVSKVRDGAKVTKKYDPATTPHRRAERHTAPRQMMACLS